MIDACRTVHAGIAQAERRGPILEVAVSNPHPAPLSARDFVGAIGAGFADGIDRKPFDPRRFDPEAYGRGYEAGGKFASRPRPEVSHDV